MRTRGTTAARPEINAQASCTGPLTSSLFGMKWSAIQTPSHPVCSAWRATPTISDHVCDAFGHTLKCIQSTLMGTDLRRSGRTAAAYAPAMAGDEAPHQEDIHASPSRIAAATALR